MVPTDRPVRGRMAGAWRRLTAGVCLVAVLAALACSGSPLPPASTDIGAPVQDAVPREVRAVASASVRVTEAAESAMSLVDRVDVSPASLVLDLGQRILLSARAYDEDDVELHDIKFSWMVPDARAGTMLGDGSFQAGYASGVFRHGISVTAIQNTLGGIRYKTAQTSVTVVGDTPQARLTSVEIIPGRPTVLRQQIFRLRAIGLDSNGLVIPGVGFTWKLNDPGLGRINDIGLLTVEGDDGTYLASVSVTAVWEGVQATAESDVQVISAPGEDDFLNVHALPQRFFLDPGDRIQLRAVALNGLGRVEAGTELRWEMVDEGAGTIDGAGFFVAGDTPGVYAEAVRVVAMVPGESGFVRADDFASVVIRRVSSRRLHTLSVQPNMTVLPPGGRTTLTVRTVDESEAHADDVGITWEILKEGVGEINETGIFTAGAEPGIYEEAVRVTAEQRIGDETVTRTETVDVVITGTLTRSEVDPSLAVVAPGRTVHFSLTGWDENDVLLRGLVVLWSVTDDRAGTIDLFGNFKAGTVPGTYGNAVRAEIIQRLR